MYCPICGSPVQENQKFCQNCGSPIREQSLTVEEETIPEKVLEKEDISDPYRSKEPIKGMGPREHSKKCLAYSIISIGFFIAGISVLAPMLIIRLVLGSSSVILPSGPIMRIILSIVSLMLHIIGLILATSSRSHSKQANLVEPENSVEKVGSVFAIFGIILNIIGIVVSSIFFLITIFFVPFGITYLL